MLYHKDQTKSSCTLLDVVRRTGELLADGEKSGVAEPDMLKQEALSNSRCLASNAPDERSSEMELCA